jgi:hypothetical protein
MSTLGKCTSSPVETKYDAVEELKIATEGSQQSEPKCKTCGDTGRKEYWEESTCWNIPCPDCNQQEELKPIPGYEGLYSISPSGDVYNIKRKIFLKHKITDGYHRVHLKKGKKSFYPTVSRLVASAFLHDYSDDLLVDHINMDTNNNHYSNLRMATRQQNAANRKPVTNSTSVFKGVSYDASKNKYVSQITFDGKNIVLGYYENEETAALMYDAKAVELFGEYARTNLMMGLYRHDAGKE